MMQATRLKAEILSLFLKNIAYFKEKQEKLLKSGSASCKITKGVLERRG